MENLKNLIKKVVTESIADLHYMERLYDRFINKETLEVGYEILGKVGEYIPVGTYKIPNNIKEIIKRNAGIVEKYNFPRNKSYGIKIVSIIIDKNTVQYYDENLKNEAKNKNLVFLDSETNSNGNEVYLIVRSNNITTIYFAKNYVSQDVAKMRVDAIIKNIDTITSGKIR